MSRLCLTKRMLILLTIIGAVGCGAEKAEKAHDPVTLEQESKKIEAMAKAERGG